MRLRLHFRMRQLSLRLSKTARMIRVQKIRKSHGARRVGIIRMQAKLISITAERRRRLSRLEHGSVIHLQEQVLNSMLRKIIHKVNLL